MAFALITSLLNTIEFHFLQPLPCFDFDDRKTIVSLCEKLRFLQAFLEDYEKNNIKRDARKVLETKIRDVAHDAEGKIESELHQLYMRCNKVERPIKPPWSPFQTLQQVKRKIESIERRIQIESNNNHSVEPQRRNRIENIKYGSFLEPSSKPKNVMVGCDDEFHTIIDKLISHSKKLEVISIVGMGGIGKTTLIKRVYEDETIISHFYIRTWATVSQKHNIRDMLLRLLGSIDSNQEDIDCLKSQLRQKLMGQRYLVVIDDIWSTEAWDDIYRCFPEEDFNGSRILLTTRLKPVANYASSGNNPHYMRFLNANESWNLFYKKVFEEKKVPLEFEVVGRGIVEKCEGLPLTIIVIAGLLTSFNKPSLNQWKIIVENLNSLLSKDPEEKCLKILSLSYDHLPPHLKVCFLYFGVFPKDSEIRVKKVIRLWVAEGFLKLELNKTMEEVADAYLQDLIDRSLVQIDKWSFAGKIKSCRLHNVLHSFCLREAQRENLLDVVNENNFQVVRSRKSRVHKLGAGLAKCLYPKALTQTLGSKNSMLMRMSTGSDKKACRWISDQLPLDWPFPRSMYKTHISEEFRSFLYFPNASIRTYHGIYSWSEVFCCLKLLRVLDIRKLPFWDHIPSEIVNLVHLRYLALRTHGPLKYCQWFKLRSLQTFIVEPIASWELSESSPLDILDMPRLRHVQFYSWSLNLPKLVQENLQTISWLYLPAQCLQTESNFIRIPNVKKLGIYIDIKPVSKPEILREGALLPYNSLDGLVDLRQLESLKIDLPQENIFRGAFQLPTAFPRNLKKLTLQRTCLPWDDMAIIGTLPNLEALKLKYEAFCGPEWKTMDNGFCRLKYLKIVESHLEHWSADADHFPVLECLILTSCKDLKEFPTDFDTIITLQLIELTQCRSSLVTSAKRIQKELWENIGDNKLVVRVFHTLPQSFFGETIPKMKAQRNEV